jgi:hypothetical protein
LEDTGAHAMPRWAYETETLEGEPRAGYYVCENCGRHVSEAEALDLVTEEAG